MVEAGEGGREGGREIEGLLWLLSFTEIETSFIICHEF